MVARDPIVRPSVQYCGHPFVISHGGNLCELNGFSMSSHPDHRPPAICIWIKPGSTQRRFENCKLTDACGRTVGEEPNDMRTIELNPIIDTSNGDCARCRDRGQMRTARRVIRSE